MRRKRETSRVRVERVLVPKVRDYGRAGDRRVRDEPTVARREGGGPFWPNEHHAVVRPHVEIDRILGLEPLARVDVKPATEEMVADHPRRGQGPRSQRWWGSGRPVATRTARPGIESNGPLASRVAVRWSWGTCPWGQVVLVVGVSE